MASKPLIATIDVTATATEIDIEGMDAYGHVKLRAPASNTDGVTITDAGSGRTILLAAGDWEVFTGGKLSDLKVSGNGATDTIIVAGSTA